jgi:PPE-repeat protein
MASGHSQQAAAGAATVASAFEAARTTTVPLPMVWANRATTRMLAATNFLGLNVQAIMAAEANYEQMWAQNVTAMLNYHLSASSVWSQLGSLAGLFGALPGLPKPAAATTTAPPTSGGSKTPPPVSKTPTPPPATAPPTAAAKAAAPPTAAARAAETAAALRAEATLPAAAEARVPVQPIPRAPMPGHLAKK